jgi:hypothetical protein
MVLVARMCPHPGCRYILSPPSHMEHQTLKSVELLQQSPSVKSTPMSSVTFPSAPLPTLATLPPELHLLISTHLRPSYPDLLSFKLTSRVLYQTVNPTVFDRVTWLINRQSLGLPVPRETGCCLRTDKDFVAGKELRRILMARRRHLECKLYGVEGCLLSGDEDRCFVRWADSVRRPLWPVRVGKGRRIWWIVRRLGVAAWRRFERWVDVVGGAVVILTATAVLVLVPILVAMFVVTG